LLSTHRVPTHLHSFPTRRSSDLLVELAAARLGLAAVVLAATVLVGALEAGVRLDAGRAHEARVDDVGVHLELAVRSVEVARAQRDRKSTRLNSSHLGISYAVFCL